MTVGVPGLRGWPDATTPAERRRRLGELDDAELVERVVAMALDLRSFSNAHLDAISGLAGLPAGEIVASPFALRAVTMAVAVGSANVHHELRVPIAWPSDWQADDSVADEAHGTWVQGALHTGKYQAFLHDEPLATYNPGHMAKWAPHELMHRVCRFFWRADMTRWELYLASRLNELLPVVLWYGPDEVLRLDRDGFDRSRDQGQPNAPLERALWLREPASALRAHAERTVRYLRDGIDHFERELAAIDAEIAGSRQVAVEHELLDSASDAAAYVVGQWNRLTSPTTGQLIEGLLTPGVEYESDVWTYRDHIVDELDRLLFGELEWSAERSRALFEGRLVWDWIQRAAQAGPDAFEAVSECLPEARAALAAARTGRPPELETWAERLAAPFESPVHLANGDSRWASELSVSQLYEGIASVLPATVAYLERLEQVGPWMGLFVSSEHCLQRGPLAQRIARYSEDCGLPAEAASLLAFELALLGATERDDQVERLGVHGDDLTMGDLEPGGRLATGQVIANRGFRLHRLEHDVASLHVQLLSAEVGELGSAVPAGPVVYLVGALFDAVAVLPAPPNVAALWERLQRGAVDVNEAVALLEPGGDESSGSGEWPQTGAGWLVELLLAGAAGWVPSLYSAKSVPAAPANASD